MSGTETGTNQERVSTYYKTPKQRATIQAKMLTTIESMEGPDAVKSDMEAFFGGVDDEVFSPERTCGIIGLEDPKVRLTMVRLYMLSCDCTIEDVFSQTEENLRKKREMGESFREIILSGDISKVGPAWAGMTEYLNNVKIRPADLLDDQTFTDSYQEMAFYRNAALFHGMSMGQSADDNEQEQSDIWEAWHAPEEQQNFTETYRAMYGIDPLITINALKITDEHYSSENNAKRAPLESVLPSANLNREEKDSSIFMGFKLLEELEILGISDLTKDDVPLRELARLSEPLEKVETRDFGEEIEKYKLDFDELMDFEELDFDDPLSQSKKLTSKVPHTVQNKRDLVQTTLFDQLIDRYGAEVEANDIEAFFGNRKDADFERSEDAPDRPLDLNIKTRRLDMMRLYMVAVGEFSVEDVFSQDKTMMDSKRECGEEFCKLMLGGDAAAIAEANAKMAKYLMNAKIPNIDLRSDESIVENYAATRFLIESSTALFESVPYLGSLDEPPETHMTQADKDEYAKFQYGINVYKQAIAPKLTEITSENYSGANDARIDGINFGNPNVINGKVPDSRFITSVSSAVNASIRCRDRFMVAEGKGFGSLTDIKLADLKDPNVSPEQAEKIKEQYRKPGNAATEKTTRESLSFGAFQMEVETRKHAKKQAEIREAVKSGTPNMTKSNQPH